MQFLVTRPFYLYQNICPSDVGHLWNWPLSEQKFKVRNFFRVRCHTASYVKVCNIGSGTFPQFNII